MSITGRATELMALDLLEVDASQQRQAIDALPELPDAWRQSPAPTSTQQAGTRWAASGVSAALRVPSVVVPWEHYYVVGVHHAAFSSIRVGEPEPFRFDRRL